MVSLLGLKKGRSFPKNLESPAILTLDAVLSDDFAGAGEAVVAAGEDPDEGEIGAWENEKPTNAIHAKIEGLLIRASGYLFLLKRKA
jgi:hypothetical protein